MHIYGASNVHGPQQLQGPHWQKPAGRAAEAQGGDQVQFSAAAEAAAEASETAGVRSDLVARVRSEIAAGTYETPAKLDAALDRLLNELA